MIQPIVWDFSHAFQYWQTFGELINHPFNPVQLRILTTEVITEILSERITTMPSLDAQMIFAARNLNKDDYTVHINNILDFYQPLITMLETIKLKLRYDYVVSSDYIFNTNTIVQIRLHCTKPTRDFHAILKKEVDAAVEAGEQIPTRYLEIVQNGYPKLK